MSSSHFARTCILLVAATLADEFQDHVWAAHHWQVTLAPELVMRRIQCRASSLSFPDHIFLLAWFKKTSQVKSLVTTNTNQPQLRLN
jgi:hypothetical protein